MKKGTFFIFTLLSISIPFLSSSFAQDYTRMGLPEGAIARLGKGYINDIAYAPDGTKLAIATSIGVWLYDTATDTELNFLSEEPDYVQAIAFSPDSRTLASGGYLPNNVIRLWDTGTGKLRDTLDGYEEILALTFSPDGTMLASSGGWPEYPIQLWNLTNRQLQDTLFGHTSWTFALAFSADGKTLISGSEDSTVRLWDVHTGELHYVLSKYHSPLTCMVFSPDGKTLASASRDSEIILWDIPTRQRRQSLTTQHTGSVYSMAFSPDGKTLASGSHDKTLRLWDPNTGEHRATVPYLDYVTAVAFSPDGTTLAIGWGSWSNNRIQLLDTRILQPRETLVGHTEDITDLAFSPDGGTLASASYDGTILLWKTKIEGSLIKTPEDVNGDGNVNIDDLTFVADHLDQVGEGNTADVNGDGIVNVLDLTAIAKAMERNRLPQ